MELKEPTPLHGLEAFIDMTMYQQAPMIMLMISISTLIVVICGAAHAAFLILQPRTERLDLVTIVTRKELVALYVLFVVERAATFLSIMDKDLLIFNMLAKITLAAIFLISTWTLAERHHLMRDLKKKRHD